MMPLGEILTVYRARLRVRSVLGQEALAVLGIAVGVSLLFASQVASTSLDSSVRQLNSRLVGSAQFQLDARGPEGFSQAIVAQAQRLPAVRLAIPLLELPAVVRGPSGSSAVDLIGADPQVIHLGTDPQRATRSNKPSTGILLPTPVASTIGAGSPQPIEVQVGASVVTGTYTAALRRSAVGALVDSQIALAPLSYVQRLAGMPRRVTRIFVQVHRGRRLQAEVTLRALARRAHLNLVSAAFDARAFAVASAPAQKGEQLFSAISAIVGFLFAFNAMLLTLPQRRKLIEGMRRRGTTRGMSAQMLAFDALVIGTLSCVVGLLFGELLSRLVFHVQPGYLAFAFPVGTQRIVTWQTLMLAVGSGMLAAFLGVAVPMRTTVMQPLSASSISAPHRRDSRHIRAAIGGLSITITTLILALRPQAAVPGSLTLLAALVCLLPFLFDALIALLTAITGSLAAPATKLALIELRDPSLRVRLLAVAATGAVAVFGSVAVQGAQRNLQAGLDRTSREWSRITPLWVSASGVNNTLSTTPFSPALGASLRRLPGVASVNVYRGSFLDLGARRLWVIAPPRSSHPLAIGQLTQGEPSMVTKHLSGHGWTVISETLAHELHLQLGGTFMLPSPVPMLFRIAGLSTNSGWPPGVVVMNSDDYALAWGTDSASAFNISLRSGVSPVRGRHEVQHALGSRSGLVVQTDRERERAGEASSHQGLSRLSQIGNLILLAAIIAVAGVMSSTIWQRRDHLGALKRQGLPRGFLWRALFCESAALVGLGCVAGALFGLFGQLLISHALASVTGFPISIALETNVALLSVFLVCTAALCIISVPGHLAVRGHATSGTDI